MGLEQNIASIHDIHQTMVDKQLNLVFEGEITQEITKSVLAMAEKNMESTGEDTSIKKKVFNVMVECLQNICKHADEVQDIENGTSSIFLIGKEDSDYIVSTGNLIYNEKIGSLEAMLNKLNTLDSEGLRNHYKEVIKSRKLSDRGGAGLGFIDIARRTGNNFDFYFEKISDQASFFSLKVKVSKN